MFQSVAKMAAAAMLAALAGGCATVTSGKNQTLSFDTDPGGADCTLIQSGLDVARFRTPNTVSVHRASAPLIVACSKPGYRQTRAMISATTSAGAWGNLVVGGIVGVMIDQSSGAAFRYYDPPRLVLPSATDAPPEGSRSLATGVTLLAPTSSDAAPMVVPAAVPASEATPASPPAAVPAPSSNTVPQPASGQSRSRL
jgi:hypothetical protein